MTSPDKLWTKDFIFITLENFLLFITFFIFMTTLALYAMGTYSMTPGEAGFAVGVFVIGGLAGRLFSGKYIEVIGRKKFFFTALILNLVISFGYLLFTSASGLYAVRFIHGVIYGLLGTAISTLAMDMIPMSRKGEGTGYFTLAVSIATAAGPLAGTILTQYFDYSAVFYFTAVTAFVMFFLALFINVPQASIPKEEITRLKNSWKLTDFFEKHAVPISVSIFLLAICYAGIVSFLEPYTIERGCPECMGLFFVIYVIVVILTRPFVGKLLDRKGYNAVYYPAFVMFFASLIVLGFATGNIMFYLAAVLAAMGYGVMLALGQAVAVKESPRNRVALANSTYFIMADAGLGIGPIVLGLLIPWIGYEGMFFSLTIVVALAAFVYIICHGRSKSPESTQDVS
ncbi:MAG TPA: MFS transporter [Methanoregula sp.]|nr:MFS transporter [Methanoregula sp.]